MHVHKLHGIFQQLMFLFLDLNLSIYTDTVSTYEPRHEKTNVLVSDLGRHKAGCTATEDGKTLEISDLESRGITLSMKRKQRR